MNNKTVKPHSHQPLTTNSPERPTGTLWLTITEAAAYARVCTRTIRNWTKKGLPCVRQSRKTIRINAADLDRFLLRSYSTIQPDAVDRQVNAILKDLMK